MPSSSDDEYSINFIDQLGSKNNPPPDIPAPSAAALATAFWDWLQLGQAKPVVLISKTGLDDAGSNVKVRLYADRFYNTLFSYDNATYTTQLSPKSFDSYYDDDAFGGSVELAEMLLDGKDVLKFAGHYRYDQHTEWEAFNETGVAGTLPFTEPHQNDRENLYSLALENTYHPIEAVDLIAGLSYDNRDIVAAEDWVDGSKGALGSMIHYPTADTDAVNYEFAAAYRYDATGTVHASVSHRTRFPTLFELYSNRFGAFTGNAGLQPESTTNWEAGIEDIFGPVDMTANLFYSDVTDAIDPVSVNVTGVGVVSQDQNVGKEIHKGVELAVKSRILDTLKVGGNYTYMLRIDPNKTTRSSRTRRSAKLYLYADWQPIDGLSIVPSVEWESKRWLASAWVATLYYRGGDRTVTNLKANYRFTDNLEAEIGVNNLFDANYEIEDAYHAPGRNFFTNVRMTF